MADPARRHSGVARLYGAPALARFRASRVMVIGLGGVGSWAVEALARSGIGALTLVDLDHVAESNLNRQVQALESTLGQAKVDALAARVRAIDAGIALTLRDEFASAENLADLLDAPCDAVIDAIDEVRVKAALIAHCRAAGQAIVTCGGAGGRSDPTRVAVRDLARTEHDPLLASLRARLRREHGYPRDTRRLFGVDCVCSDEPLHAPADAACAPAPGTALACAGYGSSVCVTASFGFSAAARVLDRLAARGP